MTEDHQPPLPALSRVRRSKIGSLAEQAQLLQRAIKNHGTPHRPHATQEA
jgi:hypothetical protein